MPAKTALDPRVLEHLADLVSAAERGRTDGMERKPDLLQRQEAELMDRLAELGGRGIKQEDVVFEGTRFVIPEKVSLSEAVKFLGDRHLQEDKPTNFSRVFPYRPWDGAHATQAALRKAFGVMGAKSTFGMFGQEHPPELHTINVGPGQQEQVPWGALTLPILPGATIYLGSANHAEFGVLFSITVEAPRKYRHQIEGIFKLVEEELKVASIYKGKAIDGKSMPDFLDLKGVDPRQVIYSDEAIAQLDASVWSMLEHTDVMRRLGVPLKRSVLLEGPYGTGKTLAAYLTAQKAVANGWTFLMCRPGRDDFREVMQTARLYQPAVVFFEDVDTISGGDTEKDGVSLLNAVQDVYLCPDVTVA